MAVLIDLSRNDGVTIFLSGSQLFGELGVCLGYAVHDERVFWNLIRRKELGESLGAGNTV